MSKAIAIIGATGAQGLVVIKHLLGPSQDGSPSPWKIRALTRDPNHKRAKELLALGAELVQGTFTDSTAIHKLFDGAYGAFVNTDGFTVGAAVELHSAFVIWEIAQRCKLRHFVWSNLDYLLRLGNYDPIYSVDHYNGKGRFADYLESRPNPVESKDGTMWSILTTGPYLDMLVELFSAFNVREDGTRVFVSPIGDDGVIPLTALDDIGWWARYIFDNATTATGKNLEIASHLATFPEIVDTFKRVTGLPAEYKALPMDEYFDLWDGKVPVAADVKDGDGLTWEDNFRAFFAAWRDHIVHRDMEWIKSIHQPVTLEQWMRDNDYNGVGKGDLLKNREDWRTQHQLHDEKRRKL